ncbi:hypothetical protein ABZP36_033109 [Zizania latifolia]
MTETAVPELVAWEEDVLLEWLHSSSISNQFDVVDYMWAQKRANQKNRRIFYATRVANTCLAVSSTFRSPRIYPLYSSRPAHRSRAFAMATTTAAVAPPSTSTSSVLLLRRLPSSSSSASRCLAPLPRRSRLRSAPQVILRTSDLSSSADVAEEEAAVAPKIGKRVRVTAPIRVYHVMKAPDLDIQGMEGVVKQYVAIWKGKLITANFPFKVEFHLDVEGQPKPVRFFAHLREDEFEFIGDE